MEISTLIPLDQGAPNKADEKDDQFSPNPSMEEVFSKKHADLFEPYPPGIDQDLSNLFPSTIDYNYQYKQPIHMPPSLMVPLGADSRGHSFPMSFPSYLSRPPPQLPDNPILRDAFRKNSGDFSMNAPYRPFLGMPMAASPSAKSAYLGMVDVQKTNEKSTISLNDLQTDVKHDLFKVESSAVSETIVTNDSKSGRKRSSRYRGVTKHRRSGRWEAHIWVKELGRQVYLGGYENEDHAAEAYDVAAIKCKGPKVKTNFDLNKYTELLKCMDNISLDELIMAVRRQSQGFARGTSSFRGVTYHPSGRWESRIGIPGSKHIYLGLYEDESEAAKAYDRSLVRLRGSSAATNFALSEYRNELAEYHKMQQLVLMGPDVEKVLGTGPEFEKWIKYGYQEQNQGGGQVNAPSFEQQQQQQQQQGLTMQQTSQPEVQPLLFMDFDKDILEQPNKKRKIEPIEQVAESNAGMDVSGVDMLQSSDLQINGVETDLGLDRFHNDVEVPLAKIFNPQKLVDANDEQAQG